MYGKDWEKLPNHYELFTDVVNNLDEYKKQYREILLQNIIPKKPLVEEPTEPLEPEIESPDEISPVNPISIPKPPISHQPIDLHIHDNCRCQLVWMNNRWVWMHHEDCCDECERLADQYNNVEAKQKDFPLSKELNMPIMVP